jgi:hypothetical protein
MNDDIPKTYAELVGLLMPRPLHDESDIRTLAEHFRLNPAALL